MQRGLLLKRVFRRVKNWLFSIQRDYPRSNRNS